MYNQGSTKKSITFKQIFSTTGHSFHLYIFIQKTFPFISNTFLVLDDIEDWFLPLISATFGSSLKLTRYRKNMNQIKHEMLKTGFLTSAHLFFNKLYFFRRISAHIVGVRWPLECHQCTLYNLNRRFSSQIITFYLCFKFIRHDKGSFSNKTTYG